ncbi:putative hydrolase YxeP [Alicyclobacillus contaminans]|uniref:M20 metallopeptidase family protein n=1 Tax=Alicyclobacillus contaminans TaxID=392016 RepID=UPI0003FD65A3|nr:amidohydrolase [Alicyclobacillus contaminans]GMA51568.1 putative hydrolase YxeP [Alicyclobacillus contaminans]
MTTQYTLPSAWVDELIEVRRTLHQYPEVGLEEVETTRRIVAYLDAHGIERLDYPLSTGVLAVVRGRHRGPCVAVRADIDALPIEEQTGLPYASKIAGTMHACGHDFHTACVLGAARLAKQVADSASSFAGTILFVFQPAEELGVGAQAILDTGVLRDFQVGAILGEHNNPLLEFGKIGVKAGPLMGSVDEFRIVVRGVGGHAAVPQFTVDPILVAANLVAGLQHVVSRAVSPLDSVVVTVGMFHAGTARNVIPGEAVVEGTVRCLQPSAQDVVEQRLKEFVLNTVQAYGATADIEYERQLPCLVNDARLAQLMAESAAAVVGAQNVVEAEPTLAGEDFAVYQQHLPGCFFWVGTGKPHGWHHPSFDVDERMLKVTSEVFVHAALAWLEAHR